MRLQWSTIGRKKSLVVPLPRWGPAPGRFETGSEAWEKTWCRWAITFQVMLIIAASVWVRHRKGAATGIEKSLWCSNSKCAHVDSLDMMRLWIYGKKAITLVHVFVNTYPAARVRHSSAVAAGTPVIRRTVAERQGYRGSAIRLSEPLAGGVNLDRYRPVSGTKYLVGGLTRVRCRPAQGQVEEPAATGDSTCPGAEGTAGPVAEH